MQVRLLSSEGAFLDSLSRTKNAVFAVCGRSRTPASVLSRIGAIGETRAHRELIRIPVLHSEAELDSERFFRAAAKNDLEGRFAYTARVPLAVPEYEDLQLVFLLLALGRSEPAANVLVLAPDAGIYRLLASLFLRARAARPRRWPGIAAWLRLARSALRAAAAPRVASDPRVVIFTLGGASAEGRPDTYFGRFPEHLGRLAPVATVFLAEGARVRFPRNARAFPLESFISWSDLVHTALDAVARAAKGQQPARELSDPFHALLAGYLSGCEIERGEPMLLELCRRAFSRMLRRLRPQTVMFPLECRTWEKHLVVACRSEGLRCSTIGYQHSSITPRHLAFRLEGDPAGGRDLPDRLVTCGEVTAKWLAARLPILAGRITVGVALRSLDARFGDPSQPAVLVTLSSSRAEAWALMQATAFAARHLALPFIIRCHPTIAVDDLFDQIRWEGSVELSRRRTLLEDIGRASFIVYSSSTVALEGMRYGRIPVFFDIGDVPSGDPVDPGVACRFGAANLQELVAVIERLAAMPSDEIERLRNVARSFGSSYLRVPDEAGISEMARAVLAC